MKKGKATFWLEVTGWGDRFFVHWHHGRHILFSFPPSWSSDGFCWNTCLGRRQWDGRCWSWLWPESWCGNASSQPYASTSWISTIYSSTRCGGSTSQWSQWCPTTTSSSSPTETNEDNEANGSPGCQQDREVGPDAHPCTAHAKGDDWLLDRWIHQRGRQGEDRHDECDPQVQAGALVPCWVLLVPQSCLLLQIFAMFFFKRVKLNWTQQLEWAWTDHWLLTTTTGAFIFLTWQPKTLLGYSTGLHWESSQCLT